MAGEIGTAFVRIRPNTSGFKSEAEAGIKSGLSPLTKIGGLFGIALGAEAAAGFVKSIATGAADLQKQGQALVQEFGQGGADAIKKFAEGSAADLGVSADSAERLANRFGLLFNTLGIGSPKAEEMTINLTKLAASVAQIRGVDPGTFFSALPTALAGNLRSLKQMGIATDAAQIKLRALALSSRDPSFGVVGTALTPTQKALAVYSIVMDSFDKRVQQAQAHSNSFANIMRRLKANFDDQKDALGAGLLPALSKLGLVLIQFLPGAFAAVKTAALLFAGALKVVYDIVSVLSFGHAKTAVEAFVAALVIKKVLDFASAMKTKMVPAIADVGTTAVTSAAEVKTAAATMSNAIVTGQKQVADAAKASPLFLGGVKESVRKLSPDEARKLAQQGPIPFPGIGQFQSPKTFDRPNVPSSTQFQKAPTVRPAFSGGGQNFFLAASKDAEEAESKATSGFAKIGAAAKASATATQAAWAPIGKGIGRGIEMGVGEAEVVLTGFKGFAIATAESIKAAMISALPVLLITIAIQLIIDHFGLIKKVFFEVVKGIEGSWDGLKDVLIGTAKIIGGSIALELTAPLQIFLKAIQSVSGVLSAIGINIGGSVKSALATLKGISYGAVEDGARQAKAGGEKIAKAFSGAFSADPTDAINAGDKATAKVIKNLTDNLTNVKQAIDKGVQVNNDAVINARQRLASLGTQLAQAITQENLDVQQAVEQAKSNTLSLANTLSDSIGQLLQAPLDKSNAQIQAFTDKRTLDKLRQSIFLPGGKTLSSDPTKALAELRTLAKNSSTISKGAIQDYILQYQQASNQVKQDQINQTKQATQARLSTLGAELDAHKITLKQFHAGVLAVLKKDKIPYAAAGKYLGQAFLDGFHQQTKDLFAQALQVTKTAGLKQGAGTTGFNADIVKPLKTLHDDQLKIHTIEGQIAQGQRTLTRAIAAHAAKQLAEDKKQTKLHEKEVSIAQQLYDIIKQSQRQSSGNRHKGVANKTAADLQGGL